MFVLKIISIFILVGVRPLVGYKDYDDLDDDDMEYYVDYYDETPAANDNNTSTRTKRYQGEPARSFEKIDDVKGLTKGALQHLTNMEVEKTSQPTKSAYRSNYIEESNETLDATEKYWFINELTTKDFSNLSTQVSVKPESTDYKMPSTDTLDNDDLTTKRRELDIPRLMEIIADLASEFETNLTRKLNETLFNMSIPTCTTPTTEAPTTSEYDANYTGATIAKCYVCGLDIPGIPKHAHCADAFAGDFLPLVPVDPSARGKISSFKKYCKYSNIPGYRSNFTRSRAIYGRWTGGCAVRWIDLSGIYTQRTCRSRLQPTMGKHFASKRMAKLERSLWNLDNGCIISPVATLIPLSRGISLYARFHACVCTGNWCNSAYVNQLWTSCYLILLLVCTCLTQYIYIKCYMFYII